MPLFAFIPFCCTLLALALLALFVVIFTTIGRLPEDEPEKPAPVPPADDSPQSGEPAAPPG